MPTIPEALALAVEVETLARQYTYALLLGDPPLLPADEIGRVAEKMRRMKYGQSPD